MAAPCVSISVDGNEARLFGSEADAHFSSRILPVFLWKSPLITLGTISYERQSSEIFWKCCSGIARASVWLCSLAGHPAHFVLDQEMWVCATRRGLSQCPAVLPFYHLLSLQLFPTDPLSNVIPGVSHDSVFFRQYANIASAPPMDGLNRSWLPLDHILMKPRPITGLWRLAAKAPYSTFK